MHAGSVTMATAQRMGRREPRHSHATTRLTTTQKSALAIPLPP